MRHPKYLDKKWDPKKHGGYPLCALPAPLPGVETVITCPSCKTKWTTVEQDGETVWTKYKRKKVGKA